MAPWTLAAAPTAQPPPLQIWDQPSGTCSHDAMACRQHAKCHRRARPALPRMTKFAQKRPSPCHARGCHALTRTRGLMPGVFPPAGAAHCTSTE